MLLVAAGLFYTNDANRKQQQLGLEQQKLALQGQIADRFTAAIDQLGQEDQKKQDKLSIRLGGIYALQRLMIDSPADQPAVVQVLCAFVRAHASSKPDSLPAVARPAPTDVRAAVTVLSHRPHPSQYPLDFSTVLLGLEDAELSSADLTGVDLRGVDLTGADLNGADLTGADLTAADLRLADLTGARLTRANLHGAILIGADLTRTDLANADLSVADLTGANLNGTDLTGADLRLADLNRARLPNADLTGADLTGADLTGANLAETNLTEVQGLSPAQLSSTTFTNTARLPADLQRPAPSPVR
ncbi:pentapeptide repeat-containing protein [Actinoplanes sp. HUAS TT8]|uniref:pentapeptide repeat-containing protein n=1 Tax=Actinoplanes sp. HUAS TT8 TaxID=3447453 RepID=UPI003F5252E0